MKSAFVVGVAVLLGLTLGAPAHAFEQKKHRETNNTANAAALALSSANATGVGLGVGLGGNVNSNITGSPQNFTGNGGGGANVRVEGSAPGIVVNVPGGGGSDCPTVGFGVSGSGMGGGGGFGPTWISSDCNDRKVAELIPRLLAGGDAGRAGLSYLASQNASVLVWLNSYNSTSQDRVPAPMVQAAPRAWQMPEYCYTVAPVERPQHKEACHFN